MEAARLRAKAGELRGQAAAVEQLLAVLEGTPGVGSLADLMEVSRARGTDAEVVALVRRAFP